MKLTKLIQYTVVASTLLLFGNVTSAGASGKFNGLYYETKGSGNAVIFLHGGQMDRRMWDEQFDLFAKRYYVVRYDIRGFGKSDPPQKVYSDASDLHALLEHLEVKRPSLVGLSLGGAVAMDFAIQFPKDASSLVLVCPGLGGFQFQDKAADSRIVFEAIQDGNYEKATDAWLKNPYMNVAMENPSLREKLTQLTKDNIERWLNNPLLNRRMYPPAAERLAEIRVPTLIIGGERDTSDIQKIVTKLATEISGAKKRMIPDAGHLVPMEKPDEFSRITFEFLSATFQP